MNFKLIIIGLLVAAGGAFGAPDILAQAGLSEVDARRVKLESDLKALEAEIEAQKSIIEAKQRERQSLERDIFLLDAKITEANLNIKARNLAINKLSSEIASKQKIIGILSDKIEREKQALAQLIRRTDQIDDTSLPEIVFGSESISDFFSDTDRFTEIGNAINRSYREVKENRRITAEEKAALEEKKNEEVELRKIQELQKRRVEEAKKEKARILKETKGKEAEYQKILSARQKDAAAIRSELFILRGSAAIPFGKALEYANAVNQKTGVRQAFLLGIIAEETNLGENLGSGNWRVDMHPTRDRPIFEQITRELGLDPDKMPVSKSPWYGWGGAMGPAQFIPSTWILYKDKIANLTGHNPPNPWDPYDAFMAAGILLKESGAAKQTVAAERYAAMCYFAGCKNANKKEYQFYADDVMALAAKYQAQINILQGN